ncbi:STAS domain-containing protein [Solimonas terrae]|uniref:STAS domain-containing protein n=1 Tax=Solimonas terrae TaxID=1396819 RepID=A0A6M2BWI6_9GAMM|nr:STAS domain-containing protein [Solimonas terrae]NGY06710.1 STAS domain-containing protein [Solimonas terrae]
MSELQGSLQFATVAPWFARADELAAADTIDLGRVTQCDSAGAALLLELQRRARSKGRTLAFTNAPTQLRDLVTFFGIGSVLNLAA